MRLIDADALIEWIRAYGHMDEKIPFDVLVTDIDQQPTIDAEPVRHGRWVLEAHKERVNYRWNVTAKCSECEHEKGEIYAGFFPEVPDYLAKEVVLNCAESVSLENYCPNCGNPMDGGASDER